MEKKKIRIGLAPTRRNVFSVEDSLKYKKLIEEKLRSWGVDFVNLDSLIEVTKHRFTGSIQSLNVEVVKKAYEEVVKG